MLRKSRDRLRLEWWHHFHWRSRLLSSFCSTILHTCLAFSRPLRFQDGHWRSAHHMNITSLYYRKNGNSERECFQAGSPSAYISSVTPISQGGWESSLLSGQMPPSITQIHLLVNIGYQLNTLVHILVTNWTNLLRILNTSSFCHTIRTIVDFLIWDGVWSNPLLTDTETDSRKIKMFSPNYRISWELEAKSRPSIYQ